MFEKDSKIDAMVGERLASERRQSGFTISNICAEIGIPEFVYRQYEMGTERLDARTLQKICVILDISPAVLFNRPASVEEEQSDRPLSLGLPSNRP